MLGCCVCHTVVCDVALANAHMSPFMCKQCVVCMCACNDITVVCMCIVGVYCGSVLWECIVGVYCGSVYLSCVSIIIVLF